MIKKTCLLLALSFISNFGFAQNDEILDIPIRLDREDWTIEELLDYISNEYDVIFSFGDIDTSKSISLPDSEWTLEELLNAALSGTSVSYTVKGRKILLYKITEENKSLFDQTFQGKIIQNNEYKTPLYGATIVFLDLGVGVTSNLNGNFTAPALPRGQHQVRVSFVGFKTMEISVSVPGEFTFELEEDLEQLESIEIKSSRIFSSVLSAQASVSTIRINELPLKDIPRLLGEPDLIRMIQNLPGVKTESDFSGGFSVRGGRNDQNLILLDGVPVYNPWHMYGLFSAFNTEAIERVELTKGVFPAQYGSRLSSVLDIELQKGDKRLGAGYLTWSPMSLMVSYGRPLNQKTSYLVALRRTYMDPALWLVNALTSSGSDKTRLGYNFMDLNMKVVHTFRPDLRLETGLFIGNDVTDIQFKSSESQGTEKYLSRLRYGWTNATGSLKLIKENDHFKSVSHLFTSQYFSKNIEQDDSYGMSQDGHSWSGGEIEGYALTEDYFKEGFGQRFSDIGVQQDITTVLSENVTLFYGAQGLGHFFSEGTIEKSIQWGYPYLSGGEAPAEIPPSELVYFKRIGDTLVSHSMELSGYASASIGFGKWSFYPGARVVHYTLGNYSDLLPRINGSYQITDRWSITAGYGHFSQYVQTVGFDLLRLPTERWFWADETRKPATAKTATIGVEYVDNRLGRFTLEGYYKKMGHLLSFSPRQLANAWNYSLIPLFGAETIEGSGEAYGAEFLWHKTRGDVRGWLGYTLSWVWNTFPELSNGERFPARTDKRHDIQTFWTYDFAKNWGVGALFTYKTGQPITFSTGSYLVNKNPLDITGAQSGGNEVIHSINNYRLPAYHRLDLSLTWKNRKTFKRRSELSLNVINVYNRLNVLVANNGTGAQVLPNGKIRIIPRSNSTGQMPIIPMLSLRIALGGDAK